MVVAHIDHNTPCPCPRGDGAGGFGDQGVCGGLDRAREALLRHVDNHDGIEVRSASASVAAADLHPSGPPGICRAPGLGARRWRSATLVRSVQLRHDTRTRIVAEPGPSEPERQ